MTTSSKNAISNAVNTCIQKVDKSFTIKPKQLEAIINILTGFDTLAILPTSYGKSMIFQLLPSVCQLLEDQPNNAIIIVVSPLKALIKDQIAAANGLTSLSLRATDLDIAKLNLISSGHFNMIIDTPEAWLDVDDCWKTVLSSHIFRKSVKCIVVDEAHKVSWGVANPDGIVFRDAFSRIGDMRSFCSESVPILALSATVNKDYCDLVNISCSLSSSVKLIYTCSDRPNIRLSVVKLKEKSVLSLNWIFRLLLDRGVDCPKMLIYCRTQSCVGYLFEQFLLNLELNVYVNRIKSNNNFLVGMFHADTDSSIKERVLTALTSNDGNLRVIIATSALRCGINCKDIKYVVHFGPSYSLVDYCQQIGRAGRSGDQHCHAVLYSYPQGGTTKINESMKQYIKTTTCLRSALFTQFNENGEPVLPLLPPHVCCSMCSVSCVCGADDCVPILNIEDLSETADPEKVLVRNVTLDDKEKVHHILKNVHSNTCSSTLNVPSGIFSGLTLSIINEIVANLKFISSTQYILQHFNIIDRTLAENIFGIIKHRFREPYSPPVKRLKKIEENEAEKYEFGDWSSEEESFGEECL